MIKLLFLLSAFYFLLFVSNAEAINYRWASTTGGAADSCAGANVTSGTTPVSNINLDPKSYQTVSQVLACAQPGDWVIFKGGSYGNIFPPASTIGGSGNNLIKLIAAPGETVTAQRLGHFPTNGFFHAFSGTSAMPGITSGVTGGTFRLDGTGPTSGFNVEIWFDGILENMEIAFSINNGIFDVKRSTMKNLWVHHNGTGGSISAHGIYTGTRTPLNNNNVIDGGIYENNAGYGINCYTGCEGTIIKNVIVRNNGSGGIIAADHFGSGNTQVYNNIVYGNGSDGVTGVGINIDIYSNTIWNNSGIGIRMETGSSDVKNNLMVANSCSNGIFSNGCVTVCGVSGNVCTNNVNTETVGRHFVNAPAGDFRLCRGVGDPANCPGGASSAIGAGAALGAPYDVAILNPGVTGGTGISRPQPTGGAWDAGAFESAATGPPPTLITMQITGPTINATHVTTTSPVTVSGSAAVSGTTITSCTWTNSQGGGGNCSAFNQTSFSVNNITLTSDQVNTITVTLDDGVGNATPVTDAIAIAYSPPALIDAWGFDEGAGLTTTGVNGNVLTINGASWTTAGKYTNALSFNGINNSLSMASSAALNKIIGGFTLSAQVYPTVSIPATFRAVAARNYNMYLYNSVAGLCGSGNPAGGFYDGANFIACDTQPIQINQFTCMAMTYDGLNVRLYTNGNIVETQSAVGLPDATAGTFQVGATMHGEYFQGVIDELRLYNRALSDSEVKSDCSTAITSPPAPGTVAVKFGALGAKFGASANAIRLGPTP